MKGDGSLVCPDCHGSCVGLGGEFFMGTGHHERNPL